MCAVLRSTRHAVDGRAPFARGEQEASVHASARTSGADVRQLLLGALVASDAIDLAVGETVILLQPPSTFSRCINSD